VLVILLALTVGAFIFAWKKLKVGAPTPKMAISEGKKIKDTVTAFGNGSGNGHGAATPEAFAAIVSPALSSAAVAAAAPVATVPAPVATVPAPVVVTPEPIATPPGPATSWEPATAPEQVATPDPDPDPPTPVDDPPTLLADLPTAAEGEEPVYEIEQVPDEEKSDTDSIGPEN
jgi:hypothetical protein